MPEVDISVTTFNVFADIEFADEYLLGDVLRAESWDALDDTLKGRALVSATRVMLGLPWVDAVPDPTETQASPIPDVCSMLAADLAAKPAAMNNGSADSNIKLVKAGSVEVEYFSPVDGTPPINAALWDILIAAGLIAPAGVGDISVTLDGPQAFGTSDGCRPLYGRYPWVWPIAEQDAG